MYKGEWNIPFKYGFSKRGDDIKVNLHVYEQSHPEMELNLIFRDKIKEDIELFEEYKKLKIALLKDPASFQKNNSMFTGYNLGKDAFIRKVLRRADYSGIRFLRRSHLEEWKAVENILKSHDILGQIDRSHVHHFILTRGTVVISYAYLENEKAGDINDIFSMAREEESLDILRGMVEK